MMRKRGGLRLALVLGTGLLLIGAVKLSTGRIAPLARVTGLTRTTPVKGKAAKILARARAEVERGVRYDAAYRSLDYPGGDVPAELGACTDVIVRALREVDVDLQERLHEDMRRNFHLYPKRYGLKKPDPNIDHRRAANHVVYLRRHARVLPTSTAFTAAATWQAGDLVYWGKPDAPWHCGVISDRRNANGLPWVIHNIGGAREEDALEMDAIAGHFRLPETDGDG
ncbi:MAG: DUF1287 domain-containing protein [Actinomycetota bacterium]